MAQTVRGLPFTTRGTIALAIVLLASCAVARAQGPQFDVGNPPGAPNARGSLGPALGASGTSGFDASPVQPVQSIFGGRPGPSATRAPINQLAQPRMPVVPIRAVQPVPPLEPASVPRYGELDVPDVEEDEGPADGLTLDRAIEILLQQNLNLIALKYEIPMAEADVLTASLRNNPIFYADGQLLPYGHYSFARPGGPQQYDVNVTQPIDVWRKRKARMAVAERAKSVTEAQFQDAVRNQIDNLYTAYVDVVAARLTLRFSETYTRGLQTLIRLVHERVLRGEALPSEEAAVKAQLEMSELQIRESHEAYAKTRRSLGMLLNIPPQQADAMQLRSKIKYTMALPVPAEELASSALERRPDVISYRMGLLRAEADVRLAKADRYSDVYMLYQPYTFQNNTYLGLKSAYSYAFGVTVALPLFNRNQGNVRRTQYNVEQSRVELAHNEQQVAYDVVEAIREFELSLKSVIEIDKEVLPASAKVRDTAFTKWKNGDTSAIAYLDAQKDFNDAVRTYREALVRHRRSMLDLNTAVGARVLP